MLLNHFRLLSPTLMLYSEHFNSSLPTLLNFDYKICQLRKAVVCSSTLIEIHFRARCRIKTNSARTFSPASYLNN